MISKRKIGSLLLPGMFFIASGNWAQVSSVRLEQFLKTESQLKRSFLQYPAEVKRFYEKTRFQTVWIDNTSSIKFLSGLIKHSPDYGLRKEDYQPERMRMLETSYFIPLSEDSIRTEIQLTDALIHFLHDIVYGNEPVKIGYNGINYFPGCQDISAVLSDVIINGRLLSLPSEFEPRNIEYDSLKKKIKQYNGVISGVGFREVTITSTAAVSANKPLLIKLFQFGFIDSLSRKIADKEVKEKVKASQKLFNLLADGILRNTTLEAFNVPLQSRLKELNSAINTTRWLNCIKKTGKVIIVNIPSAALLVYDNSLVVLESKIVAGKRSTPTPVLCSKITEVDLYPYWMVPHSIATKELLPDIKRNINYLNAGNYQVINRQGKIMNPYKINWNSLNTSNFPYIIRQSTGCDNALGLVKLNFYNPYSVYLHDTPLKNFFSFNRRYFSHGCMRVEKAMELAHLVLKNNSIAIDTLEEKGCLYNQAPVVVPADEVIPVFVLYNTAWIDSAGKVFFSEDVYRKNKISRK